MNNNLQLWMEMSALQNRYVHAIDNNLLETWPEFFTEDGTYTIISRENADRGLPAPIIHCRNQKMMRDRIVALRHANIYEAHGYRHALGGLVIESESAAEVRTVSSYIVVNTGAAGDSVVYQAGVYRDTVVKCGGGWYFKEKRVIYDTSRVQTLLATPI
ncbi:anthranilate 1,2-dioxygenase small subunit AndAd [Ralstonia soli]|uniref:Aromatic-ring-hydroxylating dioxygenase subunit beta n=1 Tax=Ralstonia soli TaxID=2953896 RepID=A0ABT1ALC8_9RALS|nr:anthranilate 1,2-dioxygenase small subunit AndAd [Ralstonia soli]MCO5399078.1 aromatic-ring-hydroxylating dioxygenase subunit beta [Ralstonia soli]